MLKDEVNFSLTCDAILSFFNLIFYTFMLKMDGSANEDKSGYTSDTLFANETTPDRVTGREGSKSPSPDEDHSVYTTEGKGKGRATEVETDLKSEDEKKSGESVEKTLREDNSSSDDENYPVYTTQEKGKWRAVEVERDDVSDKNSDISEDKLLQISAYL